MPIVCLGRKESLLRRDHTCGLKSGNCWAHFQRLQSEVIDTKELLSMARFCPPVRAARCTFVDKRILPSLRLGNRGGTCGSKIIH